MPDKVVLTIELPPEELEDLAQRRGYETPADYIQALIESDAEAHGEILPLIERFRRSLRDAIEGKTYPVSTLWE
jgi:hypothetical protein